MIKKVSKKSEGSTKKKEPETPIEDIIDADDNKEITEEQFFTKNEYDNFTRKYNIEPLVGICKNPKEKEKRIVPDDQRRTSEIMSPSEYARVLSERAIQIEKGSVIFVEVVNETDPIAIAKKEIDKGKCPLKIERRIMNNNNIETVEIFRVNEMIIPFGINTD